jgi:riboflavin synthase
MFTGIVQTIGTVSALTPRGGDVELQIDATGLDMAVAKIGDSISVSGVCLTVTRLDGARFSADLSRETLDRTTLGALRAGSRVNLEAALCAGEPFGGHLVSGHVDATVQLLERHSDARSTRCTFELPAQLARYVAAKGSVCLDGVSLTVNEVGADRFGVNLIPHTETVTTLGSLQPGDRLNVEVDLIARYLERLAGAR